ncbi:MAG: zf-TFIIB domain-containing protein [Rhodoluna sp.]|jgi:Zn-finger nucleic acid-binding protein
MLTCPKCQEAMRTYERNGVNVDQCTGCKGIFLDRGELEALINAEAEFSAPAAPAAPAAPQRSSEPYYPPQNTQQPYRKKKSFLGEFLDFD